MLAGIDGLHMTTKYYEVKDIQRLKSTGWKQSHSGEIGSEPKTLIRDNTGNEIRANKIYNNESDIAHYDISSYGLLVHLNPSKVYHDYNLISTGHNFNQVIKSLQSEMRSVGIDADIHQMNVSRIDLSKQSTMIHSVSQYAEAFRLLQAKRANKKEYPNGYYFHNKKREAIFYDKGLESKLDEVNFMRGEVKYKDTRTVQSATKIKTLYELTQCSNEDLNLIYNKHLIENVFCRRNIGIQSVIDFNSEVSVMKSLITINKRNAWLQYLAMHSIDEVINRFGSIDNYVECWREAGYQRRQLYQMKQNIKTMLHRKSFLDNRKRKQTSASLLEEVYQKFAC